MFIYNCDSGVVATCLDAQDMHTSVTMIKTPTNGPKHVEGTRARVH